MLLATESKAARIELEISTCQLISSINDEAPAIAINDSQRVHIARAAVASQNSFDFNFSITFPLSLNKKRELQKLSLLSIYPKNADVTDLSEYTQIGSTGVYYRKYLNMVELYIGKNNVTITNQGITLATLPQGLRPTYTTRFEVPITTDPSWPSVIVDISPSTGNIQLLSWSTVSNITIYVHHMYLVD